ncbi:MAG TPA: iron-containing redox enzyme family protein [Acidimicrobiales bacterium]|jgi:pyrroloquinoline quinone (PQQ) biosynthesis protein C|nr:iron-containing redox enzyme family protein [Acidimicrobiales bacterium]
MTNTAPFDAETFCADLVARAVADPRSMMNHPFVAAVAAGTATREQLIEYGTGMYRVVLDAQRWTASGYAQCDDQQVRARMLHSMVEEETGSQSGTASHADLVADFVAALGQPKAVTIERSRRLKPHFQAWADLAEFLGRCRPFWMYRGTTSLAGEAQFTDLCKLMVDVLPARYGITGAGLAFWQVHIPIDAEHTSSAVAIVAPYMAEPENRRLLEEYVFLHMDIRYRAWLEPLGEIRSVLA